MSVHGHPLFCEVTVENSAESTATAASAPVVVPKHKTGGEAPKNKTPPEDARKSTGG